MDRACYILYTSFWCGGELFWYWVVWCNRCNRYTLYLYTHKHIYIYIILQEQRCTYGVYIVLVACSGENVLLAPRGKRRTWTVRVGQVRCAGSVSVYKILNSDYSGRERKGKRELEWNMQKRISSHPSNVVGKCEKKKGSQVVVMVVMVVVVVERG